MTNLICYNCPTAHNGINGRYCHKFGKYVEYSTQPLCYTQQPPKA